jgi:hypothetical protein
MGRFAGHLYLVNPNDRVEGQESIAHQLFRRIGHWLTAKGGNPRK